MPVNVTARFFGGGERVSGGGSAEIDCFGYSYPSHLRPVDVHRIPRTCEH
jgi:hypothetical protein